MNGCALPVELSGKPVNTTVSVTVGVWPSHGRATGRGNTDLVSECVCVCGDSEMEGSVSFTRRPVLLPSAQLPVGVCLQCGLVCEGHWLVYTPFLSDTRTHINKKADLIRPNASPASSFNGQCVTPYEHLIWSPISVGSSSAWERAVTFLSRRVWLRKRRALYPNSTWLKWTWRGAAFFH